MMLRLFAERRCRERAAKALKKEGLAPEAIEAQLAGVDWARRAAETAAADGLVILDALAASGLRSIRYFKEVPGVKRVVVNDLEAAAVGQAHRNVAYNDVDPARVCPQQGNAVLVMHQHAYGGGAVGVGGGGGEEEGAAPAPQLQKFDVVDLDPYGSAAPFIDAAVQAVADGGLLCVTCTDLAVLNGNHPEVCVWCVVSCLVSFCVRKDVQCFAIHDLTYTDAFTPTPMTTGLLRQVPVHADQGQVHARDVGAHCAARA